MAVYVYLGEDGRAGKDVVSLEEKRWREWRGVAV